MVSEMRGRSARRPRRGGRFGGNKPVPARGCAPPRHYNAPMTASAPDYPTLQRIGWPWGGPPEDPDWQAVFALHPEGRPARVSEQHRTGYALAESPDSGFRVESPPEWQRRPVFTSDGIP